MLENIKLNEKYTLLIENTLGLLVSRQVKITKAYTEPYAQFDKSLVLNYIPKGKRSAVGTRFLKDQRIAIIEGWKEVKGTFLDSNINTFQCFEDGSFEEVLKINKLSPVYMQ